MSAQQRSMNTCLCQEFPTFVNMTPQILKCFIFCYVLIPSIHFSLLFPQVTPEKGNPEEKENVNFSDELWAGRTTIYLIFVRLYEYWLPSRGCRGLPFAMICVSRQRRENTSTAVVFTTWKNLSLYVNELLYFSQFMGGSDSELFKKKIWIFFVCFV